MNLALENVGVDYGEQRALHDVSFQITQPGLIGIVGPNGAGKSTLLKSIAGLTARTGSIAVEGIRIDDMPEETVARKIAYCSQSAFPAWPITVREIVALGRLPHRNNPAERAEDSRATELALERMALSRLADRRIDSLSGGERSRALLARTLATRARILLVDEPTADLDPYHEIRTMEILRDEANRGVIVMAVLHNLALAARFCDLLMVLKNGSICASGAPAATLSDSLLADVYGIQAVIRAHDGSTLVLPWRRID